MFISNTLSLADVALGNLSAGGNIGAAAVTVDIASSFAITQTTAAQTLTLPAPTVATPAGQIVAVKNVGTAQFNMHGVVIRANTGALYQWSGTAWVPLSDVSQPAGLMFQQAGVALVANTGLVITHNLNAATPARTQVEVRDALGNWIDLKTSAYTANSVTLTSPVALTGLSVIVIAA